MKLFNWFKKSKSEPEFNEEYGDKERDNLELYKSIDEYLSNRKPGELHSDYIQISSETFVQQDRIHTTLEHIKQFGFNEDEARLIQFVEYANVVGIEKAYKVARKQILLTNENNEASGWFDICRSQDYTLIDNFNKELSIELNTVDRFYTTGISLDGVPFGLITEAYHKHLYPLQVIREVVREEYTNRYSGIVLEKCLWLLDKAIDNFNPNKNYKKKE